MKTIKPLRILGLIILFSIGTISCEKTDQIDGSVQAPADETIDNASNIIKDYCGNTLTFALNKWNQPNDFGTMTIGNDESNLIFNFDIDENTGYYIRKAYIYIINDGTMPPSTIADAWNPDGSAHFIDLENFPFITTNINTQEHQEIISFTELENEGIDLNQCLDIAAAVNLQNPVTNTWVYFVFANSSLKSWGYYVDFCIEPCEEPTCETAYAFGGDQDDCFLNLNTQGNNWGWSNGGITEGTYQWDIIAGAGQCNISNGTVVGTLDVVYSSGVATITYNIDAGYTLEETHLHVGDTEETRLPVNKKGKFITAPGQFQYSGGSQFVVSGLSGEIWVTAHAVVCGYFD